MASSWMDDRSPQRPIASKRFWIIFVAVVLTFVILISSAAYHSPAKTIIESAAQTLGHSSDVLDDIRNATLGFQKIFVINLQSRTDHRDAMSLSASVTGLHFEYIDGVTEVLDKVLPAGGTEVGLTKGEKGNWRAHMNIAQRMIEENIQSALILEDDVDWDIRIKEQMRDFARASHMHVQPLKDHPRAFLDPTYPIPDPDDMPSDMYINTTASDRLLYPTTSPYGDVSNWDLLWLGHCGAYFPSRGLTRNRPLGRVAIHPDITVPENQHIAIQFGGAGEIEELFPPHTRVVTRANRNICTLAYGLTLQGARRLLHELGMKHLDDHPDVVFRGFCDGYEAKEDRATLPVCLTVLPELFQHHRPKGKAAAFSDVGFRLPDEVNEVAYTHNIRWSTRLNLEKLIDGDDDYIDSFPDGEPAKVYGWG